MCTRKGQRIYSAQEHWNPKFPFLSCLRVVTLGQVWLGIHHLYLGRQFWFLMRVHILVRLLDGRRSSSCMFERTTLRSPLSEVTALLLPRFRSWVQGWLNAGMAPASIAFILNTSRRIIMSQVKVLNQSGFTLLAASSQHTTHSVLVSYDKS